MSAAAALSPSVIATRVRAENGRVRSVHIASGREGLPQRVFAGRRGEDAPALAARIFALCPGAQSAAAAGALAAARGEEWREDGAGLARGVECASETLRSSVLGWPIAPGEEGPDAATIATLRAALRAVEALIAASPPDVEPVASALRRAASALGVPARPGEPASGWFARMEASVEADSEFAPDVPVAEAPDETAIFAAMAKGPAPARLFIGKRTQPLIARMRAQADAVAATIADVLAFARRERRPPPPVLHPERSGAGGAAIESPRGPLRHRLELDRRGFIERYSILAPTDWRFAPEGPFVAALIGAPIGRGEIARARVARLAATFDPCAVLRVDVEEEADHA